VARRVFLNWQAGVTFGWGILGLNVFLHWARDADLRPVMGRPIAMHDLAAVNPLAVLAALPAIRESNNFLAQLAKTKTAQQTPDMTVIDALANGLNPSPLRGKANIARCVFEDTRLGPLDARLGKFDVLLCASNWNTQLLREHSAKPVRVIFEGVDPALFHPGPKSGILDPGRFYIFSGGKVEYRKGQDLVLLAFKEFARRHDDAVLVTAWHSPWSHIAAGFKGRLAAPLAFDKDGVAQIDKWVADNGIGPGKVIDIGQIPNPLMPAVLREMDCALQPSRAEACTNLPAKEAMACGIPVIVADNTGVKDLIDGDNCLALRRQGLVTGFGEWETAGWGESDVEEIIACLESLYADAALRRRIGLQGAGWILAQGRIWQEHAKQLKALVLSL
jgi:glycosyltransferase involved in cell wall biosynthesis